MSDTAPHIDEFLHLMHEKGASDMHLSPGVPPMFRIDGRLRAMENYEPLTDDNVVYFMAQMIDAEQEESLKANLDLDFAYQVEGLGRFRVNIYRERNGPSVAFRCVPSVIPTMDELAIPPVARRICAEARGLVLVTGATGSGKSTTLAAMVRHINENRHVHVLTIEDPIEYVHQSKNSLINQREIGEHAKSFDRALRAALREDPDVILVGEMRDIETMELACRAAETGHLVLATLHTNTAAKAVDRIIESFPHEKQEQMRLQLSETLKAVIAQQLIPKVGGGRVAAFEILVNTSAIANMIREGKTQNIPQTLETQRREGMRTMDTALVELAQKNLVTKKDAVAYAINQKAMAEKLNVNLNEL